MSESTERDKTFQKKVKEKKDKTFTRQVLIEKNNFHLKKIRIVSRKCNLDIEPNWWYMTQEMCDEVFLVKNLPDEFDMGQFGVGTNVSKFKHLKNSEFYIAEDMSCIILRKDCKIINE